MRIIGGKLGGIRLTPPTKLPVRPTTDIAKEALFNILENRIELPESVCLDLYTGTGNIAFELASRGARSVQSVDRHFKCLQYIAETARKLKVEDIIKTKKADVMKFIASSKRQYDLIFADPPYDIDELPALANRILDQGMLRDDGLLIVEHPSLRKMEKSTLLLETRKYGNSSFSFYQKSPQ
ncbi:16S rRNA (guanine(966)-N(2))-methyltransferase RsmD [Sphingobacterium sp. JB170]|uniref:16S rRNA (guanine(966)-N(2))-methyltransferase RsmD n=1 Tax=Sphingobacterium sp. JB170 TaxID=1434842 RepID=UPI00097F1B44|nr:16S rRNA (guanine(966)-N(2))-methyltransferase RsmD [Sphingobacterium sp. JB170]SJN35918.1 16S rRNA (guanine(966)-N(2))-methyltransferaseG966 [Sphingobacterium sp. JB170]